ncbi:pyridoxal phosphate-dependent aminotransferase family protein [Leeuwenhoekiella sp. W20_SRS_FM14]|uniref:pyridoxal phosphate-dependent aminotransferase family protein n=1 Tax=Leeuwenhoekiella sp. W20_SRS_FM14 TaxID=3240270 RepID=UPI003F948BC1
MNFVLDHNPGRSFLYKGSEYLYFGGTSYLGLQTNPEFLKVYAEHIMQYGSSHGASRNSNIQLSIYEKTEAKLANFTKAPSCLTLSSGFMAGQVLRDYFDNSRYQLFHFPGSHAALRHHTDLKYSTKDKFKSAILDVLKNSKDVIPVVFFDSISFNTDHYPDFEYLKTFPLSKIIVIADDSHGIGVVGNGGSGSFSALKALGAKEILVCSSLAKALATPAGFILGESSRLDDIRSRSFFAGASPAAPAALATLGSVLKQVSLQQNKLKATISYFLNQLDTITHFQFNKGHAGFNFTDLELVKYLQAYNICVTDFEYAGGGANRLTRIVLSAHHTLKDIDKLTQAINQFYSS